MNLQQFTEFLSSQSTVDDFEETPGEILPLEIRQNLHTQFGSDMWDNLPSRWEVLGFDQPPNERNLDNLHVTLLLNIDFSPKVLELIDMESREWQTAPMRREILANCRANKRRENQNNDLLNPIARYIQLKYFPFRDLNKRYGLSYKYGPMTNNTISIPFKNRFQSEAALTNQLNRIFQGKCTRNLNDPYNDKIYEYYHNEPPPERGLEQYIAPNHSTLVIANLPNNLERNIESDGNFVCGGGRLGPSGPEIYVDYLSNAFLHFCNNFYNWNVNKTDNYIVFEPPDEFCSLYNWVNYNDIAQKMVHISVSRP